MPAHRFKKLKLGVENHFDGTMGFDVQFWGDYIYAIQSDEKPTVSVFDMMDKSNATQIHSKMKISRNYDTFCPAQCGVGAGKNPRIYFGGTASTNIYGWRTHSFVVPATSGLPFGVFAYYIGGTNGQSSYDYDSVIAFRSSTDDIYGYTVGNPILFNKSGALTGVVEAPDLQIYLVYSTVDTGYYWCVRSVMNDFYRSWLADYDYKTDSEDDDIGEEEGDDDMPIDYPDVLGDNMGINAGLLTPYMMEVAEVQRLASDMWSDNLWTDLQEFFGEHPNYMDVIVSLGVLPYPECLYQVVYDNLEPIRIATKNAPTARGHRIFRRLYHADFSEIEIEAVHDSFLDYAPYTTVTAYLPFIGYVSLPPQHVIGHTIKARYIIDVLTGGLTCMLKNDTVGVFAVHTGNCLYSLPLSQTAGGSWFDGIQNAITGGLTLGSSGHISTTKSTTIGYNDDGGVAYVRNADSSNRSLPAIGNAVNTMQTAFDSQTVVKGSVGGTNGYSGWVNSIPIWVETPNRLDTGDYVETKGVPIAQEFALEECKGFTQVESINLHGVSCSKPEAEELEAILKSGFIKTESVSQPDYTASTGGAVTIDCYTRTAGINQLNYNGCVTPIAIKHTGAFRKGDTPSLTNPFIVVNKPLSELVDCNYVHITEFKRYYFVDGGMEALTADTTLIPLHVDVLNSFWESIKRNNAYIGRMADEYNSNGYIVDESAVIGSNRGTSINEATYTMDIAQQQSANGAYVLLTVSD